MQVTFLFWNVYRQPLEARVARIAAAHSVDVVMLAECETAPSAVLDALNSVNVGAYCFPGSFSRRIKIFTRFPATSLIDQFNDSSNRLTIRSLNFGTSSDDILLGVLHLASKKDFSDDDQAFLATNIAADVNLVEEQLGIDHTLLVGDFNMNPFDKGMIGAHAFHAVMTKQQARGNKRTVQGRSYPYFYNPMWGHFGDRTGGPAGTYYLHSSKPHQYFWNIYDQVLLRPALMDKLTYLEILTSDGAESLVTRNGMPQKNDGSDHLPLLFQLDF